VKALINLKELTPKRRRPIFLTELKKRPAVREPTITAKAMKITSRIEREAPARLKTPTEAINHEAGPMAVQAIERPGPAREADVTMRALAEIDKAAPADANLIAVDGHLPRKIERIPPMADRGARAPRENSSRPRHLLAFKTGSLLITVEEKSQENAIAKGNKADDAI